MKNLIIFIMLSLAVVAMSCTSNIRAKNFGGVETINLKENTKLINATWKNDHLWILTREMRADEKPEVFSFKEKSSYGLLQGEIIFIESK